MAIETIADLLGKERSHRDRDTVRLPFRNSIPPSKSSTNVKKRMLGLTLIPTSSNPDSMSTLLIHGPRNHVTV